MNTRPVILIQQALASLLAALLFLPVGIGWAQTTTCAVPPPGMTHWWPGDSGANDLVGMAPGTPRNGASFTPGLVGNAFTFDGVNQFVTFGATAGNFGTSDFTVDFWFKPQHVERREALLGKRPVCTNASFFDIRLRGPAPAFGLAAELDSGTPDLAGFNVLRALVPFAVEQWYHVALARSGHTATLYINAGDPARDGTIVTGTTAMISNIVNAALFTIGRSACTGIDGTNFFTGQIDEVHVFGRALSQEEVLALYNASMSGGCKSRVEVDIKPGSSPNSINLGSEGVVPVAILGSASFSVDAVDTTRPMSFAGASVRAVGKNNKLLCHAEDVNDDLHTDLVCQFETAELNLTDGSGVGAVTGFLIDGSTFYGTDAVSIVP